MVQDFEIHTRRKKLLDMEIAEQDQASAKRLRILEAQAQEAENKLELSRIQLRKARGEQSPAIGNGGNQTKFSNLPPPPPGHEYSLVETNQGTVVVQTPITQKSKSGEFRIKD